MEKELGERIRKLRKERGLTLEELSSLCGLTPGYLSKIENGKTSLPIATLSKIAKALNVEIMDFFDTSEKEASLVLTKVDERKQVIRDPSLTGYIYEALVYKKHRKKMEPFLVTLIPGVEDQTLFDHEGEEFIFVLKGEMEFIFGDQKINVKEGECIYFDSSVPHRGRPINEKEAKVLVVICSNKNV